MPFNNTLESKAVPCVILQWFERLSSTFKTSCQSNLEKDAVNLTCLWASSFNHSSGSRIHRHVFSVQENNMVFAGLSGSFHWNNQKCHWMRLFMAHEHNDTASRLVPVFLHSPALCCAGCISLVHILFSIGTNLYISCILKMFIPFTFIPSANSSERKKIKQKMALFIRLYKICKLNISFKSRNLR